MDLYAFLKTLHVLSAAIWIGTAFQQQIQAARVRAANDDRRMLEYLDEAEFFGKRVFAPISGITALLGVSLVIVGWPDFNDAWVLIGIALWVITVVVGAGYLSPQTVRIKELAGQRGIQDSEVQDRIRRVTTVTHVDALILTAVVADMVIKPTF